MSQKNLLYYIVAIVIVGIVGYLTGILSIPILILFGLIGISAIIFLIFGKFSKKLAAFLMLLLLLGSIIFSLYYFFISNVGNIAFDVGNLKGVKIELFSNLQNKTVLICDNKCTLNKIPPVTYRIFASKNGYNPYEGEIVVTKGQISKKSFTLKKKVVVNKIDINTSEKILTIKYNKLLDSLKGSKDEIIRNIIGTFDNLLYSVDNSNGDFNIYSFDGEKENLVFNLPGKSISKFNLNKLNGIISYFGSNENFFYDLSSRNNFSLVLNRNIINSKTYYKLGRYIISSEDGVYLYNPNNNELIKNTLFDDFIPISDTKVLGLIKAESKDKLNLLNFPDSSQDILVLHDISTRDKKLIYKFDKDVENIYISSSSIFFEDSAYNLYEVKELDK